MRALLVIALGLLAWPAPALAHEAKHARREERLPTIGAAPDFALTSQDGAEVTLGALRGKVVALTFIYTEIPRMPASEGDLAPCQHARQGRRADIGVGASREVAQMQLFGAAPPHLASVEQFPGRSWPHAGGRPLLGLENRIAQPWVTTRVVKCYYLGRSPAFLRLLPAEAHRPERRLGHGSMPGASSPPAI